MMDLFYMKLGIFLKNEQNNLGVQFEKDKAETGLQFNPLQIST